MASMSDTHHHRSTTKVSNKPFKSRHSTKSKGKIEIGKKGNRKSHFQQVLSKIDRRHHARQVRQTKQRENVKSSSIFSGQHGAPRIIVIVPLCDVNDSRAAVRTLCDNIDPEFEVALTGLVRIRVDRLNQNIIFVPIERDLIAALDACRVADFIIFLLAPNHDVDKTGQSILRAIESQGMPNIITMVQGLDQIDQLKQRAQAASLLKHYINHIFPSQEKVHALDSHRDCSNVIRSLCTTTPKGINWREDRSWMLVEDLRWFPESDHSGNTSTAIVTGVIRGQGLKANRLVQVGDWGNFQIEKITDATLRSSKKRKMDEMVIDQDEKDYQVLDSSDVNHDDLADLAPYEISMEDVNESFTSKPLIERRGVLLDDHHYFSEDETKSFQRPKRLPPGTSAYQSAWFLDDLSDSDLDEVEILDEEGDTAMKAPALPQDGIDDLDYIIKPDDTEGAPSEVSETEMFLDPSPDEEVAQLAAYRSTRLDEAKNDLAFPDEIELHPNVLARERLVRYRGLKSLRTSRWETDEDKAHEPEEWNRLLQVSDYKSAKKKATRETLIGGVPPGTRVNVHLLRVPLPLNTPHEPKKLLTMFSLLKHEQKRAVVNVSITLSSDYPQPLKSKDELVLQCGPRRMVIHPIFSQLGSTPNNIHKYQRYLHPGQTAMATFIAPVVWGAVPALFFKQNLDPTDQGDSPPKLELIATGTSQAPDLSRVIAKRVILTGHPYKIHKKLVTVRYMFFNAEDVNWFKALQLWTKRGRVGYIKESLGTHGYFKATFDGRINPQDAVGISLYKRVFPRNAAAWTGFGT